MIALSAAAAVATAVAAIVGDRPYQFALTTAFALTCTFSVLAYREQHQNGTKQ